MFHHEVSQSEPATALLIDLRNFTPSLNAATEDERGINRYCHFLSGFYALCLDACHLALPKYLRGKAPIHLSSTGDGVLAVFSGDAHARRGFLAAHILRSVLKEKCPKAFGMGLESGRIWRIRAHMPVDGPEPEVETCIGSCINVAARAEAATKNFSFVRVIIAEALNELLCRELFGESYAELTARERAPGAADATRLHLQDRMNDLNHRLCLSFLHYHSLKGVEKPMPLFRISGSAASAGNPRFEALLAKLTDGAEHLAEVKTFMAPEAGLTIPATSGL